MKSSTWLRMFALLFAICTLAGWAVAPAAAQDRETKVRNDKKIVEADDRWIYNDLERGIAEAKKSGKPILVVFRCIPCEACSEFDEQVVRRDPAVRELMDQFVCVRIVHANGMDLAQFQFDFDQSLAAFLMNADRVIYGRFGSRSANQELQDMTIAGFGKALATALAWHKEYPSNKALFAAKRGPEPEIKFPEQYPSVKGRYAARLEYEGKVVQNCMHCHQVREAMRMVYRSQKQPIPDEALYPWPIPDVVGLAMDSQQAAMVKGVAKDSAAGQAGFQPGDELLTLDGQPLLSIADVQWVLHNAGPSDKLAAKIRRGDKALDLTLALQDGWRRQQNISWRATTWDLRRMATGGLLLGELDSAERSSRGLAADATALLVKHVGEYGEHAVAKRAGFQKNDVIVAIEGNRQQMTESDLIALCVQKRKPGDKIALTVLRGEKELELQFALQ